MNKTELVMNVSTKTGLSKTQAKAAVDAVLDTITEATKADGLTIPGFGSFKKKMVAESKGINPHTKEAITVPSHNRVVFKAGSTFKASVQ